MTRHYLIIDEEELTPPGYLQLPSYVDSVLSVSSKNEFVPGTVFYNIPFSFHCKSKDLSLLHTKGTILIEYYSVAKDREMKLNQLFKEEK